MRSSFPAEECPLGESTLAGRGLHVDHVRREVCTLRGMVLGTQALGPVTAILETLRFCNLGQ